MRVLLETESVPTTFQNFRSVQAHTGRSTLAVIVYDQPGEVPPDDRKALTLAQWRKQMRGGVLRVSPVAAFVGATPAVVPASLFDGIPETAPVEFRWRYRPGRAR